MIQKILAAQLTIISIIALIALPKSALATTEAAACKAVITPMSDTKRAKIVDGILKSDLLFGSIQVEAVIQVAYAKRILSNQTGMKRPNGSYITNSVFGENRVLLKKLSGTLSGANGESEKIQREFAQAVIAEMENNFFPKADAFDSIDGIGKFSEKINNMTIPLKLRPTPKAATSAAREFNRVLAIPGGREVLTELLMRSNPTMTRWASRIQQSNGRDFRFGVGAAAVLGSGVLYTVSLLGWFGPHDYYNAAPVGTEILSGVGTVVASVVTAAVGPSVRPFAQARVRFMKALRTWRIKRAIKNESGVTAVENPETTDDTSDLTEPVLKATFDRELVKATTSRISVISGAPETLTFETAGKFGNEIMGEINEAHDQVALMSQRLSNLESDIDKLSNAIAKKDLGRKPGEIEAANALVEKALETATDLSLDGTALRSYIEAVMAQLKAHINYAQGQLNSGELAGDVREELDGATYELTGSLALLTPSLEIPNLVTQIASAQKPVLRGVRLNLRGKKAVSPEALAQLTAAVTKLKELRATVQPGN